MLLSEETRTKILTEVRKYPQTRTALLPALKLAQSQVGWLPREAIAEVADLVGVSSRLGERAGNLLLDAQHLTPG